MAEWAVHEIFILKMKLGLGSAGNGIERIRRWRMRVGGRERERKEEGCMVEKKRRK